VGQIEGWSFGLRHSAPTLIGIDGGYLDATTTNGSNRMQLMVFGNDEQFLLVARYDNLGKGASGAAVQNLNLMLGLEETLGLSG